MKFCISVVLGTVLVCNALVQPIYDGGSAADSNNKFGLSAQATESKKRGKAFRNAWDDCGGMGASATERMRTIAAKIKGWAKPLKFVRNAAQDCDKVDATGTKPGPGAQTRFPGPEIHAALRKGLSKAENTLEKYPAAK